jgi:hypothetical protein
MITSGRVVSPTRRSTVLSPVPSALMADAFSRTVPRGSRTSENVASPWAPRFTEMGVRSRPLSTTINSTGAPAIRLSTRTTTSYTRSASATTTGGVWVSSGAMKVTTGGALTTKTVTVMVSSVETLPASSVTVAVRVLSVSTPAWLNKVTSQLAVLSVTVHLYDCWLVPLSTSTSASTPSSTPVVCNSTVMPS